MNACGKNRWSQALLSFLTLLLLFSSQAFADCASDGTCTYVAPAQYAAPPQIWTNLTPACFTVTNNCVTDIMVPHLTQQEWDAFHYNHESCASLSDCVSGLWVPSAWSDCSVPCGGGQQTATAATCESYDSTTNTYSVDADNSLCTSSPWPSPIACNTQTCPPPPPPPAYAYTGWGSCSNAGNCGTIGGNQTRTCIDNNTGNPVDPNNCIVAGLGDPSQGCQIQFKEYTYNGAPSTAAKGACGAAQQAYCPWDAGGARAFCLVQGYECSILIANEPTNMGCDTCYWGEYNPPVGWQFYSRSRTVGVIYDVQCFHPQ